MMAEAMEMVEGPEPVWTNPSGTLKGVGPGTELDWYVQRLRAGDSNVVKVDLCKQMLGPEGAKEIMEALENSTTARSVLLGADEIGPEGARAVGKALLKNRSLKTVFLGCNGIGEQGAMHIAEAIENNPVVEGYWLKRNQIGLTGLQAILAALRTNHTVKTLDLVQNDLGVEGARLLAEAFTDQTRPLSIISLYLSGNDFGVEGAKHIADLIRHNKTIKHLYLGLNNLGEEGGKLVAEALKDNSTIKTLAVLSNELGPNAAAAFAEALRQNRTLECLDLGFAKATKVLNGRSNRIGDEGAKSIAAALTENSSLRILNLTQNNIGSEGWLAIAEALRTNSSLSSLILERNSTFTAAVINAFVHSLQQNSTLTKLILPRTAGKRGPEYDMRLNLLALVSQNQARRRPLGKEALPYDEQMRLQEFKDIKSDYRLLKPAKDKRKQATLSKDEITTEEGEAENAHDSVKKPKVDPKTAHNRIRKLKKKLRALEAAGASPETTQEIQQQIASLSASTAESEEDVLRRRLAQIEKLESMRQAGAKLTAEELKKIERKNDFLERLRSITPTGKGKVSA